LQGKVTGEEDQELELLKAGRLKQVARELED
jgi:hypothetical protein